MKPISSNPITTPLPHAAEPVQSNSVSHAPAPRQPDYDIGKVDKNSSSRRQTKFSTAKKMQALLGEISLQSHVATTDNSETAKPPISASTNAGASTHATNTVIQQTSLSVEAFLHGMNAGNIWKRTLPDGTELGLRKAFPLDTKMLDRFLKSVSPNSLQLRFGRPFASPADIERFTKSPDVTTIVASIDGKMVGFANICATKEPKVCEMGTLVHQDYQGKKIGKALLNERNSIAKALGFKRVENLVDKKNSVMSNWVPRQPGFISMEPYKQDPQWQHVLISLEHEDIGTIQPPASMHAYVRPQEEAGEHVEKAAVEKMTAEESALLAERLAREEEEFGF